MLRYSVVAALMAQIVAPVLRLCTARRGPTGADRAGRFGDWRTDAPGVRRQIRPEDLPAPYASKSSSNGLTSAPRFPKQPELEGAGWL